MMTMIVFIINYLLLLPLVIVANIVFKKVWKLLKVLNVRVTADYRPAQAQEKPAGCWPFSQFFSKVRNFLRN